MNGVSAWIKSRIGDPWAAAAFASFLIAAYLCLVNLDYVGYWHDEAFVAGPARNLLQLGDIVGWDGRNIIGSLNGNLLNDELRDVSPPLQFLVSAAGFAIFGLDEFGARVGHSIAGLAALALFWLLLRQHFGNHSRLAFFCFLFAAGSAQLLLYFRQARYYAASVLLAVAVLYLYEQYWRTRNPAWLIAFSLASTAAFFNHYAAGSAALFAVAAYHLLFRARKTPVRLWISFAAAAAIVGAAALAYLVFIGLVGGEREASNAFVFPGMGEYQGSTPLFLIKAWVCLRDIFRADWISWPVLLCFGGMAFVAWRRRILMRNPAPDDRAPTRRRRSARAGKRRKSAAASVESNIVGSLFLPDADTPVAAAGRLMLFGLLTALFTVMLSIQPVWRPGVDLDLRYYVAALPLLLTMKGLFAEWAWQKSRLAGIAAAIVLLMTSAGAAPFNMRLVFTGERTLGMHLPAFAREIHSPYPDLYREISEYLRKNASQDDLVYVWDGSDVLTLYLSDKVVFCGKLNADSPLSPLVAQKMNPVLFLRNCIPDWIIVGGNASLRHLDHLGSDYYLAELLDVFWYPTQRPELNFHSFTPLKDGVGVRIFKRQ